MKRQQICPYCGEIIKKTVISLIFDSLCNHFKSGDRSSFLQLIRCPKCQSYMNSNTLRFFKKIYFSVLTLITALLFLLFAYIFSISISKSAFIGLTVMLLVVYLLIFGAISIVMYLFPVKRQFFYLCDVEDRKIQYKPTHQFHCILSSPRFEKELVNGNILQLRSECFQTYILLKRIDTSGECEFHPVPYPKDEQEAILPEHGELWNGEEVVAALSNIQSIERN